jgi:hypothetical protein
MGDDEARMKERALIFGGFGCIAAAVATLVVGSASAAIVTFVFLALGAGLLLLGLVRMRESEELEKPEVSAAHPGRGDRLVWIVGVVLAGFAVIAGVVAATVAVGEAIGHATAHLVTGLACLALYAGLAAVWHPQPGSGRASFRGMALLILASGAFGSFIESLGGSGYDALDAERRIASLASLHDIGIVFAPIALLAIPIGLATLVVLGVVGLAQRFKPA